MSEVCDQGSHAVQSLDLLYFVNTSMTIASKLVVTYAFGGTTGEFVLLLRWRDVKPGDLVICKFRNFDCSLQSNYPTALVIKRIPHFSGALDTTNEVMRIDRVTFILLAFNGNVYAQLVKIDEAVPTYKYKSYILYTS